MMASSRRRCVVIFGGSSVGPDDEHWQDAEILGREIALAGWSLATGGYGGLMEAASRGAASNDGEAIGVLCNVFGSRGNSHLTRRIMTSDLHERLQKLIDLGDAYIVLPGSTGTLVELAMVWELMNKNLLSLRPLFCLGQYWKSVVSMFREESTFDPRLMTAGLPVRKGEIVSIAETPKALIDALHEHWG